jgi:hypothetical protein
MPRGKKQLFEDFVKFIAQHGYGEGYSRDPHQYVPPDCGFVRFRYPGALLFTAAGMVRFHTQEEGFMACKSFVVHSDEPIELQMSFPREFPQTFPSPTFAREHAAAQSRWLQLKRSFGLWWY